MKCVFGNDYIIVYIQNSNINEECLEDLETYFKEIFSKIREIYQINMNGFYFVNVYIDSIYGVILEIEEEKLEYIEYYDDAVDMKISLHREEFLYKIKDISTIKSLSNKTYLTNEAKTIVLKDFNIINNMNNQLGDYSVKNREYDVFNIVLEFNKFLTKNVWFLTMEKY